ncbi:MAG TPA: tetratricopeptide repeat protein [Anaerolineales bacterium]
MYLQSSKYRLKRKSPRRFNLALIFILCVLIVLAALFQAYVVPSIPPPFLPTPTATRPAASYADDAAKLFLDGKLTDSVKMYKQAILLAPTNSDLYVAASQVQIFAHDYQGALENAQNAVLRSKSAVAYSVYGEALYWMEKSQGGNTFADADKELQKSLELDPNLGVTHAYYAEMLIDRDNSNWRTASAEARTAITLAPNRLESHRAMGYIFLSTGNYIEALSEYQKAIDIHDKLADLWIPLGDCYQAQSDIQNAIDAYLKASQFNSEDPVPIARIARVYAKEGQYGKSAQYAEMAVNLAPLDPTYRGLLGEMYYFNSQYDKAVAELTLAISGGRVDSGPIQGLPLQAGRVAEYYYVYGLALAKVGRCSDAVPIFRLLQQQVPDDATVMANVTDGLILCKEITPTPGG